MCWQMIFITWWNIVICVSFWCILQRKEVKPNMTQWTLLYSRKPNDKNNWLWVNKSKSKVRKLMSHCSYLRVFSFKRLHLVTFAKDVWPTSSKRPACDRKVWCAVTLCSIDDDVSWSLPNWHQLIWWRRRLPGASSDEATNLIKP